MDRREIVERYFAACSAGDVQAVIDCFTDDAVVYDTNVPPVRGPRAIAEFFAKVRRRWEGAVWRVDTFVGDDTGHCASEWSMYAPGASAVVRGSEHYDLRDGKISEIRQYWTFRPESPETGLQGFDYDTDPRFWTPAREGESA